MQKKSWLLLLLLVSFLYLFNALPSHTDESPFLQLEKPTAITPAMHFRFVDVNIKQKWNNFLFSINVLRFFNSLNCPDN